MLSLSRKTGEEIWIDGGRIKVQVSRVEGSRVVLSFTAEPGTVILRKELALRLTPDDIEVHRNRIIKKMS